MSILVTGSAGFIGSSLCSRLLASKKTVVGVDNHNDYYSTQLKQDRIKKNLKNKYYNHIRADISDKKFIDKIFETYEPEIVINLGFGDGYGHHYFFHAPIPCACRFHGERANFVGYPQTLQRVGDQCAPFPV